MKGGAKSSKLKGRSRTVHLSVSDCSIDIEQQDSAEPIKPGLCTEFRQLCGDGGRGEGLLQSLQMYGWTEPNKLQQHAVPMILHFLGKQLEGISGNGGKGKSCIVIQGPPKQGKTSSVILAVLAALDPELHQPQAILLAGSQVKQDIDKYLSVFTMMHGVNYQAFHEEDGNSGIDETSPEVKAARTAQILIGDPRRMLTLLSSVPSLCLDNVKVLVIDDAEELIHSSPVQAGNSDMRLVGLPSGEKRSGSKDALEVSSSDNPTSPVEDVVQICNVLECRQYSQNMSETYGIRSGKEQGAKVRHIILSETLSDPASKKVMRLLKSSLMKKKNLLGAENCPPPIKLIKGMKHYFAAAPRTEWVRVFAGLVQSLMFPRALIFCDEENIRMYYDEMVKSGIAVSANLPPKAGESASEMRRKAVQDFTSNKSQFLLTHSEPAVCQVMLPKVSCVFHFGMPSHMPSLYGVRLMPLDAKLVKESASILLIDDTPKKGAKPGNPSVVTNLQKLFGVSFMDMPWEFLPAMTSTNTSGKR